MIFTIRTFPAGPRVWIFGQRVHHGTAGCLLLLGALAKRHPLLAAAALALITHDRHDWKAWLKREAPR